MDKEEKAILRLHLSKQFMQKLYLDFGLRDAEEKLSNWYQLSFYEFLQLIQIEIGESPSCALGSNCLVDDWEEYFEIQKEKISKLF